MEEKLQKEGKSVPIEVKEDPERYHAFVMEKMQALETEAFMKRVSGASVKKGFVERFKRGDFLRSKPPQPVIVTFGSVSRVGSDGTALLTRHDGSSSSSEHI